MTASSATVGRRAAIGLVARLRAHLSSAFARQWRMLHLEDAKPETLITRQAAVEIRQTCPGYAAQTRVKGEPSRSCATALQRITRYLAQDTCGSASPRSAGPLVQREEAPGRWLISVGLRDVEHAFLATVPRVGKVRVQPVPAELLAILHLRGRPTRQAIASADTAIRAALHATTWTPDVGPRVRLYRPPALLPWLDHFEVAVPVARQ